MLAVHLHTGASHRLKSLLSRNKLHSTLTFTSAFSHLLSPKERMRGRCLHWPSPLPHLQTLEAGSAPDDPHMLASTSLMASKSWNQRVEFGSCSRALWAAHLSSLGLWDPPKLDPTSRPWSISSCTTLHIHSFMAC